MAQELRQSTIIEVKIGMAVNSTGVTPVTNLTIDGADEAEILKNGVTATVSIAGTLTAITGADGWYLLTLSASDTDTLGPLTVVINDDSAILPLWRDYEVVTPGYYDAKYASTGAIPVNVVQISGNSTAADNLQLAFDGTGYAGGTTLQKVNVDSLRGGTQSAEDLKDFADTGYNPATHMLALGVTLSGAVYTGINDFKADVSGTLKASLTSAVYTSINDFKATGFSTFDPAVTGVTLASAVYTGINDFKADVSITLKASLTSAIYTSINDFKATGFSTFDPSTQGVTLASAVYTSISDFKADVSGVLKATLSSATYTSVDDFKATGFSTFDPAVTGVTLASAVYTSIADFKADLTSLNDISVADIIAGIADGTYDFQEMMRLIFAASCCKVSGGSTTTITFRDSADSKNRIVATVDENGNRTAVTLDGA